MAGAAWDTAGSTATFLAGAAFGALALVGLFVVRLQADLRRTRVA
ncbi:hypothetical protein ACFQE0_22935 [Methylobacterium komagatae]|uniref:MFS transporter n=1 Tax=Methylobacterium komagatae TaxID=374425 RepID=A0ABW2BR54_9HYPH